MLRSYLQSLRRRKILMGDRGALIVFRLVIFLLLTFFLLYSPDIEKSGRFAPFGLMALYLLSNLGLLCFPVEISRKAPLRAAIMLFDISVISSVIYLSQGADTDLYLAYFLVIFMSSLDSRLSRSFLTATVACALYIGLALRAEIDWSATSFLLRIPFFYIVAFFGTFLAAQARGETEKIELRYREQLESFERREALGRLARTIARDLEGPMRVIETFASTLALSSSLEDPKHMSAEAIAFEVRRCQTLLRRFLMLTTSNASPFGMLELNAAACKAVENVRAARGLPEHVELTLELSPDLPPLRGDTSEMVVALTHLIQNAVEAMPKGGRLTLRSGREKTPQGKDRATLDVIDTGSGIPEFARSRIFEPFFTTKRRFSKSGLGLCFVSAIIEHHHAQLAIDTASGRGTRFSLAFPGA